MSQVEFYKATSRGGLDPIENSADSLHYRRSIIIRDDISQTFWVIHGSGAAQSTQESAVKSIEKMNAEMDKQYTVKEIEYKSATERIEKILAGKVSTKTQSQPVSISTIPKVPRVKRQDEEEEEDEVEEDVHEIKEFQISYFKEKEDLDNLKEIHQLVESYREKVDKIIRTKPTRSKAKKQLEELSEDIITLIYQ